MEQLITGLIGDNLVLLLFAGFIILCIFLGIRIVPQSENTSSNVWAPARRSWPRYQLDRSVSRSRGTQNLDPRTPIAKC